MKEDGEADFRLLQDCLVSTCCGVVDLAPGNYTFRLVAVSRIDRLALEYISDPVTVQVTKD